MNKKETKVALKGILSVLEARFGTHYAMNWDNVGLLVGDDTQYVRKIYVALDATDEVITSCAEAGAELLITHHPLIFSGMKRINNQDFLGRRILKLIREGIACYAMHTNYDVLGMADLSGTKLHLQNAEALEVTCEEDGRAEGIGKIGELPYEMTLRECCDLVKEAFSLETVKVFGDPCKKVKTAAVCPGAGKSTAQEALSKGADVYITGDIDHHTGIDMVAQGMAVIDAGHYGIEHIFIRDITGFLQEQFPELEVIPAPVCHPFSVI